MSNDDLRKLLDVAYKTCDIIEEKRLWRVGEFRMRNLLRLDLAKFLMYLSFSDGKVTKDEVDFFGEILEYYTNSDEIIQIVNENNIYSTMFEQQVPPVIKGATIAQQNLYCAGVVPKRRFVDLFIECFEKIGYCFTTSRIIDDRKVRDYNIYMDMLTSYASISEIVNYTSRDYKEYKRAN